MAALVMVRPVSCTPAATEALTPPRLRSPSPSFRAVIKEHCARGGRHVSLEPRRQWVVEGVAPHDPVGERSAIARATADRYRVVTADRVVP
jgi:hypothetical protein